MPTLAIKTLKNLFQNSRLLKEDEFADLLHQCHNVIRNREKLDPAAAFDEIAKILFVKVYVERELRAKRQRKNLFNVEFLDEQIGKHPLNTLFEKTKEEYEEDKIFEDDEEIRLKPATGREIVKLLERYNLSDTSEDIKGIAFERSSFAERSEADRAIFHPTNHRRVHDRRMNPMGARDF